MTDEEYLRGVAELTRQTAAIPNGCLQVRPAQMEKLLSIIEALRREVAEAHKRAGAAERKALNAEIRVQSIMAGARKRAGNMLGHVRNLQRAVAKTSAGKGHAA